MGEVAWLETERRVEIKPVLHDRRQSRNQNVSRLKDRRGKFNPIGCDFMADKPWWQQILVGLAMQAAGAGIVLAGWVLLNQNNLAHVKEDVEKLESRVEIIYLDHFDLRGEFTAHEKHHNH